jgi:hypothetical protein
MDRLEPPGNASIRVALHQDVIIGSRDAPLRGNLEAVRSWSKPVDRRSDLIRADHHDPVWAVATDDPAIPADGTARTRWPDTRGSPSPPASGRR